METIGQVHHLPELQGMGGAVDLDMTFLVGTVLFVLVFVLLSQLLFKPYLRIVEEREKQIDGARADATRMRGDADAVLADYESRMAAARSEAGKLREQVRSEAVRRESEILSVAREAAGTEVASRAALVEKQMVEANRQVDARATELAGVIARRVLGRG